MTYIPRTWNCFLSDPVVQVHSLLIGALQTYNPIFSKHRIFIQCVRFTYIFLFMRRTFQNKYERNKPNTFSEITSWRPYCVDVESRPISGNVSSNIIRRSAYTEAAPITCSGILLVQRWRRLCKHILLIKLRYNKIPDYKPVNIVDFKRR